VLTLVLLYTAFISAGGNPSALKYEELICLNILATVKGDGAGLGSDMKTEKRKIKW